MYKLTAVILTAYAVLVSGAYISDEDQSQNAAQSTYDQSKYSQSNYGQADYNPSYGQNQNQQKYYDSQNYQYESSNAKPSEDVVKVLKSWQENRNNDVRPKYQNLDGLNDDLAAKMAFYDNVKMDVRTVSTTQPGSKHSPLHLLKSKDAKVPAVTFRLYVNKTSPAYVLTPENLAQSPYKKSRKTSIYMHRENRGDKTQEELFVNAYYEYPMTYVNFIVVDWLQASNLPYEAVIAISAPKVAQSVREMIEAIRAYDSKSNIHIIAHGVSAHIAAAATKSLQPKVNRITALDAAGPGYSFGEFSHQSLNKDSANFVDAIYTNFDRYGMSRAIAQANFYVDGGVSQDNCDNNNLCSREMSLIYYVNSISQPPVYNFFAKRCPRYLMYALKDCNKNELVNMGEYTPSDIQGSFYVDNKYVLTPEPRNRLSDSKVQHHHHHHQQQQQQYKDVSQQQQQYKDASQQQEYYSSRQTKKIAY